jgi:hypothetical protein
MITLEQIKKHLNHSKQIAFQLPDGTLVPRHFHVTEVGKVSKHFIDCGGTVRQETKANFQLWEADDYDHRLHPEKLVKIINLAQKMLDMNDLEIEVEYQGDTIGKYDLDWNGEVFLLTSTQTDCLARVSCGVTGKEVHDNMQSIAANGCTPGSGCC